MDLRRLRLSRQLCRHQSAGFAKFQRFALTLNALRTQSWTNLKGSFSVFTMILILAFHFLLTPSFAQYFTGPIAGGLGGAGLGAADVSEGHLFNPASVVHSQAVEFAGFYRNGGLAEGESHRTLGVSFSDNNPQTYFPGAFTFLMNKRAVPGLPMVDEQFAQLSMAEFIAPHLSLGVSGVYLKQRLPDLAQDFEQWNGVIGALYNPVPEFGIGASVAYFVHPSGTVPLPLRLPQTVGMGVHYLFLDFARFRMDVIQRYDNGAGVKPIWKGGFETLVADFAILRLGARRDENLHQTVMTAGLSFNGPKLKFDYSIEKDMVSNNGALHSVDLRLAF